MRYPSTAEALTVAAAMLGVPENLLTTDHTVHLLDSALHSPQATWGGEELVVGLHKKMATLCVHIARNHPLPDGNKRLSWLMMNMFAEMNGHTVDRDVARSICLVWAVAAGEADVDDVEKVISHWVRRKDSVLV